MTTGSQTIDADELLKLLGELVAAPSVNPPGNEIVAARVLERYLRGRELEPTIVQRDGDRANLLCRVPARHRSDGDRKTLLLTSHLDVVPVDDSQCWRHDPFRATVEAGRVVGRGACDAKGQVAAMALAATAIARRGELDGDLLLLAVFGEERKGLGSKAAVAAGIRADAAIVGEPTQNRLCIGHPGRLQADLRVGASSTHPLEAGADRNSVLAMGSLLAFLREHAVALEGQVGGTHGRARLVPFHMAGGAPDVLSPPAQTQVLASLWFGHPLTHDDAIRAFEVQLRAFTEATGIEVEASFRPGAHPAGVDNDAPIVNEAAAALLAMGMCDEPMVFGASCDMYVFAGAGIPSIILGPGSLDQCHAANESIGIDELTAAAQIYERIASSFLKTEVGA